MSERSNDLLRTHGAEFKFSVTFGHGLEFEHADVHDVKHKLRTFVQSETPRKATLEVYSYLQSLGAVHHYAKLRIDPPRLFHAETGEPYYAFIGRRADVPFGAVGCELEVMRLVDKRDLKHDRDMAEMRGDSLYGRLRPGDWTHGHWSEAQAIAASVEFFQAHFEAGWQLEAYSWAEDVRPIFAVT